MTAMAGLRFALAYRVPPSAVRGGVGSLPSEDAVTDVAYFAVRDHKPAQTCRDAVASLSALGEHERARRLQEDTVARFRRVLGEDHPNTLAAANDLGRNLSALGEHEQARQLHKDILIRRRSVRAVKSVGARRIR